MASIDMTLELPIEILREGQPFGLDFGSSCAKIAYIDRNDHNPNPKLVRLHLALFPRDKVDDVVALLKKIVTGSPAQGAGESGPRTVNVSGWGALQYKDRIEQELNIKLVLLNEMDLAAIGLGCMMKHLPLKDLEQPILHEALVEPLENFQELMQMFKSMAERGLAAWKSVGNAELYSFENVQEVVQMDKNLIERGLGNWKGDPAQAETTMSEFTRLELDQDKTLSDDPAIFPAIIANLGSAFSFWKLDADGQYSPLTWTSTGGKAVDGKAKLMLGVKHFEEFLDLAQRGDNKNVDIYAHESSSNVSGTEIADAYEMFANMKNDSVFFNFGKASNAQQGEHFAKEDIARAMLLEAVLLIVEILYPYTQHTGSGHVFLVGTFPTNDLVRSLLTTEMTRKALYGVLFGVGKGPVHLHFVKHGAHMAPIGSLVKPPAKP